MDADLARRLAEHPRFQWQEGMATPRERCETVRDGRPCSWTVGDTAEPIVDPIPDLDDWPTAGALLGMLPSGWRIETLAGRYALWWHGDIDAPVYRGSALGEAAARALLALAEAH